MDRDTAIPRRNEKNCTRFSRNTIEGDTYSFVVGSVSPAVSHKGGQIAYQGGGTEPVVDPPPASRSTGWREQASTMLGSSSLGSESDGFYQTPSDGVRGEQQSLLGEDRTEMDGSNMNPFTQWNNYWSKPYSRTGSYDGMNEESVSSSDQSQSFIQRTVSEQSALAQENWVKAKESNWLQPFLVVTASMGLCAVIIFGATSSEQGLDKAAGRPILRNMFTAGFCFGIADIIAQVIQHQGNFRESLREAQWGRSARASLLGMFVNGVGYSVWLYFLDKLIPERDVGLHSPSYAGRLISKGVLDSYVWGILSNSVGILGRRMLEGDRKSEAIRVWHGKIITVTIMDFQFWPMWSIVNFQVVPKKLQVSFTALGAIIWNIYMALVANWETSVHPKESHQRRAEGERDNVANAKKHFRETYVGYDQIMPHVSEHSPSHPEFKLGKYPKGAAKGTAGAPGLRVPGMPNNPPRGYQAV